MAAEDSPRQVSDRKGYREFGRVQILNESVSNPGFNPGFKKYYAKLINRNGLAQQIR